MRRLAVVLFGLVFVLAACGGGAAQTQSGGDGTEPPDVEETEAAAEGDPTPGTSLTACQIVTPADIEAALELDPGSVAAGTHEEQPTVLDPAVNECAYDGEWGGLIVNVTPTDGANVYDALVDVYGDEAEALEIGDGALWFDKNNRGYFFKGSVLFFLQFTHLTVDIEGFRDPIVAIGRAGIGRI